MAKFRPGDRVKVTGELGEGQGVYVGRDKASGHAIVHFEGVEAQDKEGHPVKHENLPGYVPVQNLRRR